MSRHANPQMGLLPAGLTGLAAGASQPILHSVLPASAGLLTLTGFLSIPLPVEQKMPSCASAGH